jgi:hypothetical protein
MGCGIEVRGMPFFFFSFPILWLGIYFDGWSWLCHHGRCSGVFDEVPSAIRAPGGSVQLYTFEVRTYSLVVLSHKNFKNSVMHIYV